MNFLIVNDDGITVEGLHQLVKCLHMGFPQAKLYVCAPDRQRTASGHGITVDQPVRLKEWEFEHTARAWSCSGTPADCVRAGIRMMEKEGARPDLVCSGINMGSNLGSDVLYSGTVSAALEGNLCGIPSIAFSVCSHEPTHFAAFEGLVFQVCRRVLEQNTLAWIFNVNVPDLPVEEISGLRITRLGDRIYSEEALIEEKDGEILCQLYLGKEKLPENLSGEYDVCAVGERYISITPIHRDLVKYDVMEEMKGWEIPWR